MFEDSGELTGHFPHPAERQHIQHGITRCDFNVGDKVHIGNDYVFYDDGILELFDDENGWFVRLPVGTGYYFTNEMLTKIQPEQTKRMCEYRDYKVGDYIEGLGTITRVGGEGTIVHESYVSFSLTNSSISHWIHKSYLKPICVCRDYQIGDYVETTEEHSRMQSGSSHIGRIIDISPVYGGVVDLLQSGGEIAHINVYWLKPLGDCVVE